MTSYQKYSCLLIIVEMVFCVVILVGLLSLGKYITKTTLDKLPPSVST